MSDELNKMLKEVQEQVNTIYKEATEVYKNTEFVGESNGGRCRAVYKNKEIIDVTIKDDVLRELIPDLVIVAVNKALKAATDRYYEMQKEIDAKSANLAYEVSKKALDVIAPLPAEGDMPENVIALTDKNKN